MAEEKENGKDVLGAFSVTTETSERFRKMCKDDYRKQSQLFEFLVNSEWERRHPQAQPTAPLQGKRQPSKVTA